jgi:HD-GYP domain-containing protein (c-di-GMP phosphodiesterase class II)
MHRKVNATELALGMFVADLDRPWIDTPFLLQGFLIDDEDQLRQLRQHCQWVMIDPHRSVGAEFDTPVRKTPNSPRDHGNEPRVVVQRAESPRPGNGSARTGQGTAKPATRTDTGSSAGKPADNGRSAQRGGGTREFAVSVDAPNTRGQGLAPARGSVHAGESAQEGGARRGFWGQLKEGVSGLFARKEEEVQEYADPPDTAPAQPEHVRASFIPETVQLTIYEDKHTVEEEVGAATIAYDRTSELLHNVVEDIRAGGNLQLESVEEVIDDMVQSMVRNPDAMMWVARMREQDLTVYGHGLSVAVSLVAFGRHLGYPKEQLSQLGMLGLLLDIGKIKLPRDLLEKSARLTSDEFEQIKDHVDLGLEILAATPNIHPDVIEGIAQHHERMNGTGYPNNIMGEKIGVFGRMAAIADTYAAVTKRRPYAEAISPHEALQMLSNWSGTQFHADMVEQFIQSIGVFPVGSLVELSTGEVAVVVTHNKIKRLRPKVLVVTEQDKTPHRHPSMRDLLYDVSDNPAFIRRGLPSNAYGLDPSEYYLN